LFVTVHEKLRYLFTALSSLPPPPPPLTTTTTIATTTFISKEPQSWIRNT
jgi:hypothetical protein